MGLDNDTILKSMWFSDVADDVLPDVWWKLISASNAFIICWLDVTVHLKYIAAASHATLYIKKNLSEETVNVPKPHIS